MGRQNTVLTERHLSLLCSCCIAFDILALPSFLAVFPGRRRTNPSLWSWTRRRRPNDGAPCLEMCLFGFRRAASSLGESHKSPCETQHKNELDAPKAQHAAASDLAPAPTQRAGRDSGQGLCPQWANSVAEAGRLHALTRFISGSREGWRRRGVTARPSGRRKTARHDSRPHPFHNYCPQLAIDEPSQHL